MAWSKKSWKVIRAILKSLKSGSTHFVACKAAGINDGSWWLWRKADPRLESIVQRVLNARVQFVEDALFKNALGGNFNAQQYFLNNRARERWQKDPDFIFKTGDDNSKHITQIFTNVPTIVFDEGQGDRKLMADVPPEGCALTSPEGELVAPGAEGQGVECQNRLLP